MKISEDMLGKIKFLTDSLDDAMESFLKENEKLNQNEMFAIVTESIAFFVLHLSCSISSEINKNICIKRYAEIIGKRALEIKNSIDNLENNYKH